MIHLNIVIAFLQVKVNYYGNISEPSNKELNRIECNKENRNAT